MMTSDFMMSILSFNPMLGLHIQWYARLGQMIWNKSYHIDNDYLYKIWFLENEKMKLS